MRVKCPRCQSPYDLSEDKEGAKLRCSKCGRIFVAAAVGAGKGERDLTPHLAGGAFVVVLLLVVLLFGGKLGLWGGKPPAAPEAPKVAAPSPAADPTGFDHELVKVARTFVANVEAYNREKVAVTIHFARWHEEERKREAEERPEYLSLSEPERAAWRDALVAALVTGARRGELAGQTPFDGAVESLGAEVAQVRLQLRAKEGGAEKREIFRLALEGAAWKVSGFEIYVPEAEKRAAAAKKPKKGEPKRLSDGSMVIEGTIEPKEHLPETPPEQRQRIDALVAVLIDPMKTKEIAKAREELARIGKPAIPRLLNALATIPLGTEENDIVLNIVNETLSDMTGHQTTFAPMSGEGSMMSTSEERRQSGLKQWFGWWERNHKTFTVRPEEPDTLDPTVVEKPKKPPRKAASRPAQQP